jgi:hypothetical protein
MDGFIARANIDHYLELLHYADLAPEKQATIVKLLIAELDKLGHYQEQLEFAETRAARGRELLTQARSRLNSENLGEHAEAIRLVSNLQYIQHLLNTFCYQLRARVNSAPTMPRSRSE